MKASLRAYRYRLPLERPLKLRDETIEFRDGLLLRSDGDWADVAPLPGFSGESIDDVLACLRRQADPPPSLEFALSSLEFPFRECHVPVNALLQGDPHAVLSRCELLAGSNCRAVKLKVGRDDLKAEIDLVRTMRSMLQDDQSIRLDANRAWDFGAACAFAEGIAGCAVEYIEEPLQDPSQLEAFHAKTGVPYALDETLTECESVSQFPSAAALVCKPTLLGGHDRIERLIRTGKQIVFSACFESGMGIAQIAMLASQYAPGVAAGLDTYRWLRADVLLHRLTISDWYLNVQPGLEVNSAMLEEVQL